MPTCRRLAIYPCNPARRGKPEFLEEWYLSSRLEAANPLELDCRAYANTNTSTHRLPLRWESWKPRLLDE